MAEHAIARMMPSMTTSRTVNALVLTKHGSRTGLRSIRHGINDCPPGGCVTWEVILVQQHVRTAFCLENKMRQLLVD